jgi:hypothetical protein
VTRRLTAALLIEGLVIAALLALVADLVAHGRVERLGGVNIWGYRGPVLHQKGAAEMRIAVVGGDLAFGWGVAASETLAPAIRELVALAIPRSRRPDHVVTAVLLGAQGLPLSDYASWIDHYASLRPDVICIVADPGGHRLVQTQFLPARRSAFFRAFGYSEILPLVLEEKGERLHSAPLRLAGRALAQVDGLLTAAEPADRIRVDGPVYLALLEASIRTAARTAPAGVVVVTAPDAEPASFERQSVKDLVASAFADTPVRVVDLGDDPTMRSTALRLNAFDFSAAGHAAAANDIAPVVVGLLHLEATR